MALQLQSNYMDSDVAKNMSRWASENLTEDWASFKVQRRVSVSSYTLLIV